MPTYRVCLKCKRPMEPQDSRTCPTCVAAHPKVAAHGAYMREYWRKRRSDPAYRAKELARMKAKWEAKPLEERRRISREGMTRWRSVPENKELWLARERAVRDEVLDHYGKVCQCCGESRREFLSIDHIDGEGTGRHHVREIGGHLYRWLRREGWPTGFRTLCMNCNFSRGRYGYCPHEREQR